MTEIFSIYEENKKGVLIFISLGSALLCTEGPLKNASLRDIAP